MRRAFQPILPGLALSLILVGCAVPVHARSGQLAFLLAAEGAEGESEGKGADHELLFKTVNFILLAGALGYVLRKPLGQFLAGRSSDIQKSLEEGRRALETSQAQMRAIEEKLQYLGEEIAAFQATAAREMEADRRRLREAMAEEAAKILEAARAQILISTRAAQLELKAYTARQAVALASEVIRQRLDAPGRGRLVSQFVARLEA